MKKIATKVKCIYCGNTFDRDKEPFIKVPQGTRFRYGEASCYLKQKEINPNLENFEIFHPENFVKCIYCKQLFDKRTTPYQEITPGKFAHESCVNKESSREKSDEELLKDYIKDMFETSYVPPAIQRQIKNYTDENGDYKFTYSGILKTLKFFYEIRGNVVNKNMVTIGIVPWVYKQAHDYYYMVWLAEEKNKNKQINTLIPLETKIIKIPVPTVKIKKKKPFSFLDEEGEI